MTPSRFRVWVQGSPLMYGPPFSETITTCRSSFELHQHQPHECAAAFAAWQGFQSPLRHARVPSTCLTGGHGLGFVQADDRGQQPSRCCPGTLPSGPR